MYKQGEIVSNLNQKKIGTESKKHNFFSFHERFSGERETGVENEDSLIKLRPLWIVDMCSFEEYLQNFLVCM